MKRKDGYYWVRLGLGMCWVCALYRPLNGVGCWFMPGMIEPITDEGYFDFISTEPIPAPNQPEPIIWTPENLKP